MDDLFKHRGFERRHVRIRRVNPALEIAQTLTRSRPLLPALQRI